jgi:Coenzyme F420-reducing hydrogenase, alpha subunit
MKIIWKYVLPDNFVVDKNTDAVIEMPSGSRIVHVEILEDGRTVIWVEFAVPHDWNGKANMRKNFFRRTGTGHGAPDRFHHFHSFVSDSGTFVWHLYRFEDDATA